MIFAALRCLADRAPWIYATRIEELAYLANAIVSGADWDGERFTRPQAAEAALANVELGALLDLSEAGLPPGRVTLEALTDRLEVSSVDTLFRRASSAVTSLDLVRGVARTGFVRSRSELAAVRRFLLLIGP